MPALHPYLEKNPNFTWSLTSYKEFLESPEGKKQQTQARLDMMEMLYGQGEAQKINQMLFDQQNLSSVNSKEDDNVLRNQPTESNLATRERLLNGDAREIAQKSSELANLRQQAKDALNRINQLDALLEQDTAKLNLQQVNHDSLIQSSAHTLQSKQSKITQEEYDQAIRNFDASTGIQGEILQIARQRQAEAAIIDALAARLRHNIGVSKNELAGLPSESPAYTQKLEEINAAEKVATALESKSKRIQAAVKTEEESATKVLANNAREESRWEMAKQQSDLGRSPAEAAARKEQKSALNAAILNPPKLRTTGAKKPLDDEEQKLQQPTRSSSSFGG